MSAFRLPTAQQPHSARVGPTADAAIVVRVEVVPELVGRDLDRRVERHHSALPVVAGGRGAKAHVSDDWVPLRA